MDNSHTLGVKEVLKRRAEYGPNGNWDVPPHSLSVAAAASVWQPRMGPLTLPACRIAQRGGDAPVEADSGAIRRPAGANPAAGGRGLLCVGIFRGGKWEIFRLCRAPRHPAHPHCQCHRGRRAGEQCRKGH